MQLNGYPLNIINKTIKDTLRSHNSEHKSKELEPLKLFIPYEKGVAEKLKKLKACKQIRVYSSLLSLQKRKT